MIFNYFYIISIAFFPFKADSPLVIDSDAVLAFPVLPEFFKAVSRWDFQINQIPCRIDYPQLSYGRPVNAIGNFRRPFPVE